VALLGWNIGLSAAGVPPGTAATTWQAYALALGGVAVTMTGIMLPSTTLTFMAARWATATASCARYGPSSKAWPPSCICGAVAATGWIRAGRQPQRRRTPPRFVGRQPGDLRALVWKTRLHMLWMLEAVPFGRVDGVDLGVSPAVS